jgi:CRISPR-associated exonuclease Cas4
LRAKIYSEDDLIQLSALQHFVFCPRQCALIHIEQEWKENRFTAEGKVMHEKAHEESAESRKDVRIERGMSVRSLELGLIGKMDVVEFHCQPGGKTWTPFPVEYKRGKPKADDCDKVQLCAQALCLEEALETAVPAGAIFYGKPRRRMDVAFDEALRGETKELAGRLHEFLAAGRTPPPEYAKRCESCSLIGVCMPQSILRARPVQDYLIEESKPG